MLTQLQRSILEILASDETAEAAADLICRQAEGQTRGVFCSMVTVDRAGRLHPLAGPSLPEDYSAALDGIAIGPEVGSCGSAAFLRQPVAVTDIFTDRRWAPYRDLAEPLGMRACWSSPILGGDQRVLGAFGFYYEDHRGPSREEQNLVAECTALSGLLLDRLDIRAENQRLTWLDGLTGLGNRAGFERQLAEMARQGGRLALLLIDIDELRSVNAGFGHAAGDLLISALGRHIAHRAGTGRAFRIGGDEFAVLLTGAEVEAAMARIAAGLREDLRGGDHRRIPATLTCAGAALPVFQPGAAETLRRQADLALRHAKARARGGLTLFDPALEMTGTRRIQALRRTAQALAEHRLEAHYQPIVNLETGAVLGVEALCRVRTPQGEILPAGQLAPAMTAAATAGAITERMLALVARDLRGWLDQGVAPRHVGVNLTMADFRQDDLCGQIRAAFARHAVRLDRLVLEVTETVYLDDAEQAVARSIAQLRAEGIRIALDDFGTGYAGLTHLLDLPVDILKADKSLADRLAPGSAGAAILQALLEMARKLGLLLVAEGVETEAQAAQLRAMGCPLAQGYHFGRPMPAAAIGRMLRQAPRQG